MTTAVDLTTIRLSTGGHGSRDMGLCAMELVALLAGDEHTDHPACAAPLITAYTITVNDSLDEGPRQALISYAPRIVGTATYDQGRKRRRAYLAADRAIRHLVPLALDVVGQAGHANQLRALDPINGRQAAAIAYERIGQLPWLRARDHLFHVRSVIAHAHGILELVVDNVDKRPNTLGKRLGDCAIQTTLLIDPHDTAIVLTLLDDLIAVR
jgi:hypothetical protein